MVGLLVKAVGSVLLGLLAWQLIKVALYGTFVALVTRILWGDFSLLRGIWENAGWLGVAAFVLFYILVAIRRVEKHIGKYEDRILRGPSSDR